MLNNLIAIGILSRLSQMLSVLLRQSKVRGSAPFMMTFTVRSIGLPYLSTFLLMETSRPPALLSCAKNCGRYHRSIFERLLSDAAPEFSSGRKWMVEPVKKEFASRPHVIRVHYEVELHEGPS